MKKEIKIPDIGDFKNVPVIEVLVKPGQIVSEEETLLLLESDKATLDVPSPIAGAVTEVLVQVGDVVSMGSVVLVIESDEQILENAPALSAPPLEEPKLASGPISHNTADGMHAEVVVIGGGPGGYAAAFRAADLGKKVILIDRRPQLGGVCLNVGCIPSKALLHAAKVIEDARDARHHGIDFGEPKVDLDSLRSWKDDVVTRLTSGLCGLAKRRKVTVLQGEARFTSSNMISVTDDHGEKSVAFEHAIIAAGSEPAVLPFLPHDDPRVIDSTGALELSHIPKRMLVLGGGIIGLEMATVYLALGASVTIVEMTDQLVPGADKDLVAPLMKRLQERCENIRLRTKVTNVVAEDAGLMVHFAGPDGSTEVESFDLLLVAIGRVPNGGRIQAGAAGVVVDERGFIAVDAQMRTSVPHIFAVGDVVGQPMLAHKATHQGHVAAEVVAGHKSGFDAKVIPAVAYTDPEIAWVGLTETEAAANGVKVGKGKFPWAASGRALSMGRPEGLTKLLFDETSGRVVGAGVVGPNASDLIAEAALAIEMGATAADIGLTIHPHPTLAETLGLAAEEYEGTLTDL